MVYAAKRGKNRCPTHPGALLRDDIIPATGRTKVGNRRPARDLAPAPVRHPGRTKAGVPSHRGAPWQAFRRWRGNLDPDAERLRYLACGANRRCQPYSDHQGKGRLRRPSGLGALTGQVSPSAFRGECSLTRAGLCGVTRQIVLPGWPYQPGPAHDRPSAPRDPRSAVRFRQDRADRIRQGAGRPRRRTGLHRRHREGDRRGRAEVSRTSPSSPAFPR